MKKCTTCLLEKEDSEFYVRRETGYSARLKSKCKACMAERQKIINARDPDYLLKSRNRKKRWAEANPEKAFISSQNAKLARYGIDFIKRTEMAIEQDYRCKICQKPESEQSKMMAVDHCHKTNIIRGLLCDPCNRGLGFFRDDPEILINAAQYILNSKGNIMRRQVECLNRLFETRKCREEILQFLKDEHLINDDVMQNLLHEHHTQHASKMITLFDDLKKKEALQMVDFEWKILPKEFIQLTLVAKTAKKEITYSV